MHSGLRGLHSPRLVAVLAWVLAQVLGPDRIVSWAPKRLAASPFSPNEDLHTTHVPGAITEKKASTPSCKTEDLQVAFLI